MIMTGPLGNSSGQVSTTWENPLRMTVSGQTTAQCLESSIWHPCQKTVIIYIAVFGGLARPPFTYYRIGIGMDVKEKSHPYSYILTTLQQNCLSTGTATVV